MALKWSNSAEWSISKCQRQFWYRKVFASPQAKWGGARREANILGTVLGLPAWRGILVHNVISEWVLPRWYQNGLPSPDQTVAHALERASRQLAFSSNRRYREVGMTKTKAAGDYLALWEDEFPPDDPREFADAKAKVLHDIETSLRAFYEVEFVQQRLCYPGWTNWEVGLSVREVGVPVMARIDFLAVGADDVAVVDWKVGESHVYDYAPQLALYAALLERTDRFAPAGSYSATGRFPPEVRELPKRLVEVNLLLGETHEHDWNEDRAIEAEDRLFRSARRLASLSDLSPSTDPADLAPAESPRTCRWCPFRSPCRDL